MSRQLFDICIFVLMKWIVLLLVSLLPLFVIAQTTADDPPEVKDDKTGTFKAGIIVGSNGSQIDGDGFTGYHRLGLNVGGKMMIVVHKNWQPGFEILYTQKGSQQNIKELAFQYKYGLDYISIPVMMNYVDKRIQFTAGVAYNQLLKAKAQLAGIDDPFAAEGFRKFDLSLFGGMTFYLDVKKHFAVNARYEYSLTDSYSGSLSFPGKNTNALRAQRNKLVSFRLLYML